VPRAGTELHGKLLKSVLNSTFVFISGIDTGSLINRFNQDLGLIDSRLPVDFLNTAAEFFPGIAQVVLVSVAAVHVLAVLPALVVTLYFLQHFYLRTSKQLRQLDLESTSGLHTKFSETYEGLVTIRAHAWQTTMRQELWKKLDRSQEPFYLLMMVQTWLRLVLDFTVAGLAVTVVGVAVATRYSTSASAIGVAFLNMVTLGENITRLITSWTSLETSLGAIARIEAFEKDTPIEADIESPVDVPPEWPSAGKLVFDRVFASYNPEQPKSSWSLHDISFDVKAGERIAICGRSGSGKSTLLLSLLSLIETPRGRILLDGVDISRVPRSLLRSKYFVISQDTFSQGETIRDSLDSDGTISDDVITCALRDCAILDRVIACGGLSGKLGDINLSVGETQLFCLARIILHAGLRQGGVVLFDEATSRYVTIKPDGG
jgi:ATP-binding cassette subfamily C (CFTR/MRP) protein 1